MNYIKSFAIKSFVKRSRPLSKNEERILDEILPNYLWKDSDINGIEIGFGNGDHLYERALQNPTLNYVGFEPHICGVLGLLKKLELNPLNNLKIIPDDAIPVIRDLKDLSIDVMYILFPDPWHKKKHHKRRILNKENLKLFSKKLNKDLFVATDCSLYSNWINSIYDECFYLKSKDRPCDMPYTKYEKKAFNKEISYFHFQKKS